MFESAQDAFALAAEKAVAEKLEQLKGHDFDDVFHFPEAVAVDIVVAGKEVQQTVFRQRGIPSFPNAVLITVQLLRAGLGGFVSYKYEKGLVFSASEDSREATDDELLATGG